MPLIKVLIISAYPFETPIKTDCADRLPLGPLYALAAAKCAGPLDVKFIDLSIATTDFDLKKELEKFTPGLAAIGIHSAFVFPLACRLAVQIKDYNPDTIIIAGGIFPSSQPDLCLIGTRFDYVLQGEVDESLPLLIEGIQNERELATPGLIVKNPGGTGVNYLCPLGFPDLNKLPRIPEQGFEIGPYSLIDPLISFREKTLNISSARGCPYKCAFCCYRIIGNGRRRVRNAVLLAKDLNSLSLEYGIRQFNFVDDNFLCSIQRVVAFCKLIANNNFLWRCQARIDSFKTKNLSFLGDLLYKSGCRLISFGIESGDAELLKKIHKPIDLIWAKHVCKTLMGIGIGVRVYVIVGLPYQTFDSIEQTKQFLRQVNPTNVSVEIFVPHRGSLIGDNPGSWGVEWETANIESRIQRLDWLVDSTESKVQPCIHTKWLSAREIGNARDDIQKEWPPVK